MFELGHNFGRRELIVLVKLSRFLTDGSFAVDKRRVVGKGGAGLGVDELIALGIGGLLEEIVPADGDAADGIHIIAGVDISQYRIGDGCIPQGIDGDIAGDFDTTFLEEKVIDRKD